MAPDRVPARPLAAPFAVGATPQRLHPLVLGYEPIPEAFSVAGGDPDRWLLEPVTAAIVEYDRGWVLLDSGFNVDTVRDPIARAAHYNFDSYTAVVPPGDPLVDAVAAWTGRSCAAARSRTCTATTAAACDCWPTGHRSYCRKRNGISLSERPAWATPISGTTTTVPGSMSASSTGTTDTIRRR